MSAATSARRRLGVARGLLAAVVIAAVAAGAWLVFGNGSSHTGSQTLSGSAPGTLISPFRLSYPASWRALSDRELTAIANPPIGGLRTRDGAGILLVRVQPAIPGSLSTITAALISQLRARFPDFRAGTAHVITIASGHAFSYTFTHASTGAAHLIVLVPTANGGEDYTIDAEIAAGHPQADVEVGRIVRSFRVG